MQNINQTKVNILGTEYEIIVRSEKEDPKLGDCDGYCETYSKKIIVSDIESLDAGINTLENLEDYQRRMLKHEIIHAFLHESGLDSNSDWATNEEIVDWIALQFDKIKAAVDEVNKPSVNILLDGKVIEKTTADYFKKISETVERKNKLFDGAHGYVYTDIPDKIIESIKQEVKKSFSEKRN